MTTADISRRLHWFPHEMTSEQRLHKFHTCDVHHLDRDSAPDWLKQIFLATRSIRSTTQAWVVTHHQYGISAVHAQTSFRGKTNQNRLFSLATSNLASTAKCTSTANRAFTIYLFLKNCGFFHGLFCCIHRNKAAFDCKGRAKPRSESIKKTSAKPKQRHITVNK